LKPLKSLFSIFFVAFIFFSLLISIFCFGSGAWTTIYQGSQYDSLLPYSIIQTSDGGYASAVFVDAKWVNDSGGSWHLDEQYELWLIKFDSSGNSQWVKKFSKIENPADAIQPILVGDGPYELVQTSDGGYAIGGTTASAVFFLLKLNKDGALLWSKTYLPSPLENSAYSYDRFYSMVVTKDSGFALAGSTEAYNSLTDGGRDFWLVKIDSAGNMQWDQRYDSGTYTNEGGDIVPRDDEAYSVVQTSDGGYAIVGQMLTGSGLTATPTMWLVKIGSSGVEQWNRRYEAPDIQGAGYQVIQTSDGGYALVGTESATSDDADLQWYGESARNSNAYLIKTDSSGSIQWRKSYGDKYKDLACSVVQLSDGGFAITGTFTENNNAPVSRDLGLVRIDFSGNQLWTKLFNARENITKSDEWAYSMCRTSDGAYLIAGSTVSSWDGSHVDVFLAKTESLEQIPISTPKSSSPVSSAVPSPSKMLVNDVLGLLKMLSPEQSDAGWQQINGGSQLTQGTKIKSSENAATLQFSMNTLEIKPNTVIDIQAIEDTHSILLLESGEFTGKIESLPSGSIIDVEMSQATATIKGTVFTVTENGLESKLSVKEGTVSFKSKTDGKVVDVSAGQNVTATREGLSEIQGILKKDDLFSLVAVVAVAVLVLCLLVFVFQRRRKSLREKR
jgi:hypothetical protein